MKPKTTLNLSKDFFSGELKKYISFFLAITNKKKSLIPSTILYACILLLSTSATYSQSCKATLQVEKNRFTKSVSPEGISYSLQISNTGSNNTTYILSASNINSSCSNNDGSNTSSNVNLNISFADTNSNAINEISLSPGETSKFLVEVKAPIGTAVGKWNCTQITATATECSSYKVSTVLHTLVSDPTAE